MDSQVPVKKRDMVAVYPVSYDRDLGGFFSWEPSDIANGDTIAQMWGGLYS